MGNKAQEGQLELGLEDCADFKQAKGKGQGIGKGKGSNISKRQKGRNIDVFSWTMRAAIMQKQNFVEVKQQHSWSGSLGPDWRALGARLGS